MPVDERDGKRPEQVGRRLPVNGKMRIWPLGDWTSPSPNRIDPLSLFSQSSWYMKPSTPEGDRIHRRGFMSGGE